MPHSVDTNPSGDVLDAASAAALRPPPRFISAASLFDGHDAAINIMRRLIQQQGAEVIHLGHNRAVEEVVRAALQEDADAIAISSYQGGHVEYLKYMVERLRAAGAGHIQVFAGGGGTITVEEIAELEAYGIARVYHPTDGLRVGLGGIIADVMARVRSAAGRRELRALNGVDDELALGRHLTLLERGSDVQHAGRPRDHDNRRVTPVFGVTGPGGAGKSSVVDELLLRFLRAFPDMRIAVLAVDPTRRRTGGALLGDRIRMNSLRSRRVFMRSIATRQQHAAISPMLADAIALLRSAAFELIVVETAGTGQSDSAIVDLVDVAAYVMTSEYGAASQLEKIDMLDLADLVVINKYDRRGSDDALRDVRKQWRRNRGDFSRADQDIPVFATIASQFNDPGVSRMFAGLCSTIARKLSLPGSQWTAAVDTTDGEPRPMALLPPSRRHYLGEIVQGGREAGRQIEQQVSVARTAEACWLALGALRDDARPEPLEPYPNGDDLDESDATLKQLRGAYQTALEQLTAESLALLRSWPTRLASITADEYEYEVRGRAIRGANYIESLSHQQVPRIAPPTYRSWGELLRFLLSENLPGSYPYTAGVYAYRRVTEDPTRMFAGEGTPERTNRRFHYLSSGQPNARLSTAFDSVTLYGEDPATRPDIFGKIGNSGVSVATLDDMKKLYAGFDLAAATTSVSMTINGPAPMILAMFLNTAIDQRVETYLREDPLRWRAALDTRNRLVGGAGYTGYAGDPPFDPAGLGLALLGVSGDQLVPRDVYERIKADTLRVVRGTVQADILKEDQAQNTCIFSTEFALRMMGDIQEYFIQQHIRNFYSVSISGYHIAEAGANPISQLAFTLANGFTIVEYYLARGMTIDDFAPNLSFFFSNGMDPEYSVIGRVARRVWARAMRDRYRASPRSQMLKYHVQTSGRSLHAQEIQFNDIRTTLQALYALFDNCNSLHTNAYDEALTTPTEESVRRAVAIQLIINRELGLNACENVWQGSFALEYLTDLVERAVYREFEALNERGGVLGAMDLMYQRSKIQDESLYYEQRKHDGRLPIIGVNTFLGASERASDRAQLIRSTPEEKQQQIDNVRQFAALRNAQAPPRGQPGSLSHLQETARQRANTFTSLMEAVKYHSLGQLSTALYEVGGEYRRAM